MHLRVQPVHKPTFPVSAIPQQLMGHLRLLAVPCEWPNKTRRESSAMKQPIYQTLPWSHTSDAPPSIRIRTRQTQ
ncbi:unnamed protein product [Chondrus crispus]|uniref:Uncharacterized protein n=1 Tax=Chondrus crispus TaxID=2769 RepID=S0F3K7_CHOCR|nr:unnamed protein product [Chondrus crispus]CDF77489.1 unnamed protein product [Chondrus crispus]|eukprot:XP_005712528.1 unnamed protein product [Chondrus crispus]